MVLNAKMKDVKSKALVLYVENKYSNLPVHQDRVKHRSSLFITSNPEKKTITGMISPQQ